MKRKQVIVCVCLVVIYFMYLFFSTIPNNQKAVLNFYANKGMISENAEYIETQKNLQNNEYYFAYKNDNQLMVIELTKQWYYLGRLRLIASSSTEISNSYPTVVISSSESSGVVFGKCLDGYKIDIFYKDTLLKSSINEEYLVVPFSGQGEHIIIDINPK